jgi:hypothetical protein
VQRAFGQLHRVSNGSEPSGQLSGVWRRTVRRLRGRAARATAKEPATKRREAPVRVAWTRGGVIAERA